MSPRPEPAITFNDLTLGYDRHPAVHHINGEVAKGELLAIVGPNGAGKSTLLKGIVGELKPLGGSLKLDSFTKSDIAYLPQQIEIDRSFPISVFDCVAMGLWREIGAWRGLAAPASHMSPARSQRSAFRTSAIARSARSRAASSSVCCSRGSCCRTHPSSFSTSRSAPSTREPSPTSSLSS
jgi:ATPase subunit of ABC transporter with duplicated ATPase domains